MEKIVNFKIDSDTSKLQFVKVELNPEYKEKFQIDTEFVKSFKNGKLLNDSLYKIPFLSGIKDGDKYIIINKYIESVFNKRVLDITKNKNPNYLESTYCIIDSDGNEKVNFEPNETPYLIKNSCLYKLNNRYYNIETNYLYGESNKDVLKTKEFILIQVKDNEVIKINKENGSFEIIK